MQDVTCTAADGEAQRMERAAKWRYVLAMHILKVLLRAGEVENWQYDVDRLEVRSYP